jgi:hypothetical protein
MKQFYLLVFVILVSASSFAATITAKSTGGPWNQVSTWNLNRLPQDGDVIKIPANVTVTINGYVINLTNIYLDVSGTLTITGGGQLNITSTPSANNALIYVESGGKITTGDNSNNQPLTFKVGNSTPANLFTSDANNAITGPVYYNGIGTTWQSGSPSAIPLPVKFASFALARQQSDILVQWATAQEMNSKSFIIERSSDGTNWATVATISAAGQSNTLLDYSYTDRNINGSIFYYRIKEVDIDNSFSYTSIKSIKMDNSSVDVKVIPASGNTLYVNFTQQVKSNVTMRLISMSGQVVSQQTVSNPIGQVNFSTANRSTGIYVLSVTDGHDLAISKKVML